jgi:hypothetical protein
MDTIKILRIALEMPFCLDFPISLKNFEAKSRNSVVFVDDFTMIIKIPCNQRELGGIREFGS